MASASELALVADPNLHPLDMTLELPVSLFCVFHGYMVIASLNDKQLKKSYYHHNAFQIA